MNLTLQETSGVSVLIMAGGKGTRLWPLSTEAQPKQFCRLTGAKSLLQQAYDRASLLVGREKIFVCLQADQASLALTHLPNLESSQLIVEPGQRDTGPATVFACARIAQVTKNPQECILAFAADQLFSTHTPEFNTALMQAIRAARGGHNLVSIGVMPTSPVTQYGYMRCGAPTTFGPDAFAGDAYIEKPDLATAVSLLRDEANIWNTNIFIWHADVLLRAYAHYSPSDQSSLETVTSAPFDQCSAAQIEAYKQLTRTSIDYGVLEKLKPGDPFSHVFVKGHFEWADVGNFESLAEHIHQDENGNALSGQHELHNVKDCILICESPNKIIAQDIQGLIVVVANGHALVTSRQNTHAIKKILSEPIRHNLVQMNSRLMALQTDSSGNVIETFVRLHDVSHCRFRGDGQMCISAGGIHQLSLQATEHAVHISKSPIESMPMGAYDNTSEMHNLRVHVAHDYADMGILAADMLVKALKNAIAAKGQAVLVMSSGQTPKGLFKALREKHRLSVDWQSVLVFQMDEYVGMDVEHACSLAHPLRHEFTSPLGIHQEYFIDGKHPLPLSHLNALIRIMDAHGGIDIVVHGIGENGHLGFNEPGSSFELDAGLSELHESTIAANSRSFADIHEVPRQGLTLGLKQFMRANKNIVLASGTKKANAVAKFLLGAVSESVPASMLQRHADVDVIIDRSACNWVISPAHQAEQHREKVLLSN